MMEIVFNPLGLFLMEEMERFPYHFLIFCTSTFMDG